MVRIGAGLRIVWRSLLSLWISCMLASGMPPPTPPLPDPSNPSTMFACRCDSAYLGNIVPSLCYFGGGPTTFSWIAGESEPSRGRLLGLPWRVAGLWAPVFRHHGRVRIPWVLPMRAELASLRRRMFGTGDAGLAQSRFRRWCWIILTLSSES